MADDILHTMTGQTTTFWIARIQTLIAQLGKPITDAKTRKMLSKHGVNPDEHKTTEPVEWVRQITDELRDCTPAGEPIDGNMWLAKALGYLLTVWYARLSYAKANDPVRPLSDRRRAYDVHRTFCNALTEATTSVRDDATFFPQQKWQSPFAPEAKSGRYR
jgi:uncharacterized protein YneF (UPF0154 family)